MGPVEIRLATGSRREHETRALLEGLLKAHDLSRFLFTVEVVIAAGVVPPSHPTLTLNTRHNGEPDRLLATFLHEQLHWFAHARSATVNDAVVSVAKMFPDLPVGHPRGARDLRSSRLHIIITRLELLSARSVRQAARGRRMAPRSTPCWRGTGWRSTMSTRASGRVAVSSCR